MSHSRQRAPDPCMEIQLRHATLKLSKHTSRRNAVVSVVYDKVDIGKEWITLILCVHVFTLTYCTDLQLIEESFDVRYAF